jgi:WD40 repeat protein
MSASDFPASAQNAVRIPDHELIEQIGAGSYGEVWRARNIVGTQRAVKIVYRARFDSDRPYDREFAGIQKFEPVSRSHDGLVDVLHLGRAADNSHFYYLMELADGLSPEDTRRLQPQGVQPDSSSKTESQITPVGDYVPKTLRAWLKVRGRVPLNEAIELGIAITGALSHLHRSGLVHRDVKPSNIIFVSGQPKLADIGLVTGIDEAKSFVGTEGYIPPEGPGTPQADLYSLGKVLYEAATGKDRHAFPELPEEFRSTPEGGAFSEFNEILLRSCAGEPARRYATAEQMRAELLLLQSGRSIRGLRANERLVRRLKVSGVVGTVCLVLAAAVALLQRQRATERAEQVRALTEKEEQRRQTSYAADLAIAFQSWEVGRAELTRKLLELQRPPNGKEDLRGWEWRYLWGQSRQKELRSLTTSSLYGLWSCAFSPDGQSVAGGMVDGRVVLWNPHTGQTVAELGQPIPLNPVDSLAFTLDGSMLFQSLRYTNDVVVWDLPAHQSRRFIVEKDGVRLALSPNETIVATTHGADYVLDGPGEVRLWDARSGRELARGPVQPTWLIRVAFSPDGKHLATSGAHGHTKIWTVPDLREITSLPHGTNSIVFALAFSPEGRQLVTGTSDGLLRLWDWESQHLVAAWQGHSFGCDVAQWSPDGKLLATGGRDQIVRLWNPTNQLELAAFKGHAGRVSGLTFSRDNRLLVSAGEDKSLRSWEVATALRPDPLRRWRASNVDPELALSPDSRWVAVSSESNTVALFSLPKLETAVTFAGSRPAFSPDNRLLVTLITNRLHLFSVADGSLQRIFEADERLVGNAVFAPDGSRLAMGTEPGSILIWSLTNSAPSLHVAATNRLEGLFFTEDGRQVITLHADDGTLEWFDLATSRPTRRLITGEGSVTSAALSPNGESVLIGETAPRMRLANLATGHVDPLDSDMGSVVAVAWSADGQTLAAGTFDGFIKLWNARTLRSMATLRGHTSLVTALEFSHDGRHLISGSFDNTWRVWSAPEIGETEASSVGP